MKSVVSLPMAKQSLSTIDCTAVVSTAMRSTCDKSVVEGLVEKYHAGEETKLESVDSYFVSVDDYSLEIHVKVCISY